MDKLFHSVKVCSTKDIHILSHPKCIQKVGEKYTYMQVGLNIHVHVSFISAVCKQKQRADKRENDTDQAAFHWSSGSSELC